MTRAAVAKSEYNDYYKTYINKVDLEETLLGGLTKNLDETIEVLTPLSDAKFNYRYAPEKWTIKELIQHLIDTERIFAYRALCIARKDKADFPGFNENDYVVTSHANSRTKEDLLSDFRSTRNATIALFSSFSEIMLQETGIANGSPISARALGFITIGHVRHHLQVLRERYI